uniref:ShKT domain-containing protein n=1 Tax=Strongyloides venezuelensis TaxID=75913 RepID=A0A0K0F9K5_STRVS
MLVITRIANIMSVDKEQSRSLNMKSFLHITACILLAFQYVLSKNCSEMATIGYCANPWYRQIMCTKCRDECAATKNPCIIQTKDLNCKDKIDDCTSKVHLCNLNKFEGIMSEACPSTCGNCSGNKNSTIKELSTKTSSISLTSSTKKSGK